jgi:hypothetical protein
MKKILVLSVIAFFVFSFSFLKEKNNINFSISGKMPNDTSYCRAGNFPKQDISRTEENNLKYMREEEKLAHDFYSQMYDKWELRLFYNISGAELRHMNALKSMLDKYSISDPVKDKSIGTFTDNDIKKLYENLIEQGKKSEIDALKAGAEIEEMDIKDLISAIKDTDNEDLKFVYNNLIGGSHNHLRAFIRNLDRRNIDYSPKHLDIKTFEEILND